jgi:GT2 family glycosyltransferase
MPKVAVQLLLWNGKDYLEKMLASLARQTFVDFELLVLDNGSTDGTAEIMEAMLKNFPRPHRLLKVGANIGFAAGHNRLFSLSQSEYVFCVNQDSELKSDYLEKVILFMDADQRVSSAEGKLLRADGRIDSAGLAKNWYEKVFDIGANKTDRGEFNNTAEVFGVSGALPVYRRATVMKVSPDGKLFDESFFSYKEDVDLAWRLFNFGYKSFCIGGAIAEHIRSVGEGKKSDKSEAWRQKFSSRNHLLSLVKNLPPGEYWKITIICFYELGKAVYLCIFLPSALGYIPEFFRMLPNAQKARKVIWSRLRDTHET